VARSSKRTSASTSIRYDHSGKRPLPEERAYQPYGASLDLFYARDDEVLLSGPAGTGKTRAVLEKLNLCAQLYPGMRGLMARKTRQSLTQSGLVTFEQEVLPVGSAVVFHHEDQEYRYPNGSRIVVGGLDKPSKIMSTQFDMVVIPEATELFQDDWEKLTTRLRHAVMPYQQIIGDCNPDSEYHWLKRRADDGTLRLIESRHEDNPSVTPAYLAKLDRLTGVRYLRLRKGLWVAAEGVIYDGYDPRVHLIDRFDIPATWSRVWVVDFGFTHPFVWQCWAVDPDGRLYLEHEIYFTHRLVETHAQTILNVTKGQPRPIAIICDHDAEDRATLERHIGLPTMPAYKGVTFGIQAVSERLRPALDGRPRIFFLRDALVERDPELVEAYHPTSTEEEFGSYVWDIRMGQKKGDQPVKKYDHGMDTLRYMVAAVTPIPTAAGDAIDVYDESEVHISRY
jgi:phage terminase large subunit